MQVRTKRNKGRRVSGHSSLAHELKSKGQLYSMALPGFIYMFIIYYIPMFGLIIAFKNYHPIDGIWGSEWAGLNNFKFFFTSLSAFTVTFNTLFYNIVFITLGIGMALLSAILFNELSSRILPKLYKSIMLLPYLISWVIASYILFALLSTDKGLINRILIYFGGEPLSWYMETKVWRFIIPMAYVWKNIGYLMIIFIAGITSIPSSYYEAADIDGASTYQKVFRITLPLLSPIIATLILLQVGKIFYGAFGDWSLFYNLPRESGILYSTTDVIDTYIFRSLRQLNDFGMSSAVGFYQSLVGCILVILSNKVIRKYNPEGAIF